jgi:hypothetical protein
MFIAWVPAKELHKYFEMDYVKRAIDLKFH